MMRSSMPLLHLSEDAMARNERVLSGVYTVLVVLLVGGFIVGALIGIATAVSRFLF